MTEEQIKQNAEAYAEKNCILTDPYGWKGDGEEPIYDYDEQVEAYIAGAHSRDEEICEWKESKRKLRLRLMGRIRELKRQWIKPSEQLPVDGDDIVYLLYGCKAGRMKYHSTYEKWLRESVSYWMRVPKLDNEE